MKDSVQSTSFSREEFSEGFALTKGDNKTKDSVQIVRGIYQKLCF